MTVTGQFYNVSRTIMLLMHLIEIEMRDLYRTATPLFTNVMVFEHHLTPETLANVSICRPISSQQLP